MWQIKLFVLFQNISSYILLDIAPANDVHLTQWNQLSPENQLVTNKHDNEQDQANVRSEKGAGIPLDKHLKATRDDNQHAEEQTIPRQVWLQGRNVG